MSGLIVARRLERQIIRTSDHATPEAAARAAYSNDAYLMVARGVSVKLVCNPTAGDNLQAMAQWISGRHFLQEGASLYLEIADGLHDVSTYIDITDGRFLDMRARVTPELIQIAAISFVSDAEVGGPAGETYTATVTVASALPARMVAGYAVGGQNVKGDTLGAEALNSGLIVKTVAVDRLSFTTQIRSHGVALTSPTTLDNGLTLGLAANQLVIPFCCLRANEAGWDGAAREAFINAMSGGKIGISFVGISYNGSAGDNDILFAKGEGSFINLVDYVVIAGAGEMCARSFAFGAIITNRSMMGGGITGVNVFQGSAGGTLSMTRTMCGSVSGDAISASSGSTVTIGLSVIDGANQCLRPTYPDASISVTSSRIGHALNGATPTKGNISIDVASSISGCTSPFSFAGGFLHGNPTLIGNTNAAPAGNTLATNGGGWYQTAAKLTDTGFYKVGRFSAALDFPNIAGNTYADLTIAAAGAAFDDFCLPIRSGATEPAQGIVFRAFVSAADVVTVRAYNITTAVIDPSAYTARVLVMRAT
jgi:hypothetical protein